MQRLFVLALCTIGLASCTSKIGRVEVLVTDAEGIPFEGALVSVAAPEQFGRTASDRTGAVLFENISTGELWVEAYCPGANGVGRLIQFTTMHINRFAHNVLRIAVPTGHCAEPPYSERVVKLRGYYNFGFEHSDFDPCNRDALNLSTNTFSGKSFIWVESIYSGEPPVEPDTTYYMEIEGLLKGPGQYGHLGGAHYELSIAKSSKPIRVDSRNCTRDAPDAA